MLRLAVLLIAIALSFATSAGASAHTSAGTAPVLAATPSPVVADPGDEFITQYTVDDVPELPGLAGYVLAVTWNPAVLEMVAFVDEGYVTSGDIIVLCGAPTIDNAEGIAVLFCSPIPLFAAPGLSTTEPVTIARSMFRAKAPGTTQLSLDGSYLIDPALGRTTPMFVGATVTVRAADTPTALPASATPQPTGTAAPTTPAETTSPTEISTNVHAGTLSELKAPELGTGAAESQSKTWRIPSLLAAMGVLTIAAALGAYSRRRER